MSSPRLFSFLFFFNDPATTEIYTLSLHDALPICDDDIATVHGQAKTAQQILAEANEDRKSTRLNSSHVAISYAVFCLKKKKKKTKTNLIRKKIKKKINTDEKIVR